VQVIPHITNEIKERIHRVARNTNPDVVITEIGGTVGDIESLPFLEAIRQFRKDVGRHDVLYMHVTLVPLIASAGEVKTKPTQHSVKGTALHWHSARYSGLPLRAAPGSLHIKEKISEFCDVPANCVITTQDASSIYEVPLIVEQEGLAHQVLDIFAMEQRPPDLTQWQAIVDGLTATERGWKLPSWANMSASMMPISPWRKRCNMRRSPPKPPSSYAGSTLKI
jgi:CTP synthase